MKKRMQKIAAVIVCSLCCTVFFGGCTKGQPSASEGQEEASAPGASEGQEEASASGAAERESAGTDQIGEFSMEDLTGEAYTQEIFADYDVTMINIFTTWCTPCINEIPDLEKLRNEMSDQGLNVVGIVLDAADGLGGVDSEAVEKAGLLAENTGVTYPFLIPDSTLLNGRLSNINAVPETIFVDREGNVLGESYTGSRSLEEWKAIAEEKLADVSGAAE